MYELALCAGIGGLSIALRESIGARVVAYVEREAYAVAILVHQMEEGTLASAPIWSDLRDFPARAFRGCVDIVTAGFPCQPHSLAGKRLGTSDDRWLFDDIARIIREVRPGLVFLENVPGLTSSGLDRVLGSLAKLGFDAEWGCFSAAEVGAPHWRKRMFILAANADCSELWQQPRRSSGENGASQTQPGKHGEESVAADADRRRLKEFNGEPSTGEQRSLGHDVERRGPTSWWATEPQVGRVVDGHAGRVDQLRALGNAVVPAQAEHAFRVLHGRLFG